MGFAHFHPVTFVQLYVVAIRMIRSFNFSINQYAVAII